MDKYKYGLMEFALAGNIIITIIAVFKGIWSLLLIPIICHSWFLAHFIKDVYDEIDGLKEE